MRDDAARCRRAGNVGVRSLTEAGKRIPPDLNQAAALLNIPGLDDAERNTGASVRQQQAALQTLAHLPTEWAAHIVVDARPHAVPIERLMAIHLTTHSPCLESMREDAD